ncbi:META domain-containing protein [Parasphingopyxis sp.]|uniref:META domain-containing protein n=1 Tax=Parasphingopyxis sp. TaxID=1920299 RepID=UPI00260EE951|nr:META domain-containing protein [Parasphingopyxis sp.]
MKRLFSACAIAAAIALVPASSAFADHHETVTEAAPDPWTGYRGIGTEPFWSVTIGEERLMFEHSGVFTAEADRPSETFSPGGVVFISRSENAGNRDFIVLIEENLCGDGMSDRTYPQSVRVFVDGSYFFGCGGDPQDVLSGADWHVTSIMGEAVPDSADINFRFDGEGGMFGTGGCNRFRADYELTEGLSIGPVASTRRACINPEISRLENQFFTALGSVIRVEISDDGVLTLYAEMDPVLTAERRGERG